MTATRQRERGPARNDPSQGQGDNPKPISPTPDASQGQEGPKGTDQDDSEKDAADLDVAEHAEEEVEFEPASPNLPEMDRSELGLLIRDGQRLALHVRSKIHLPELQTWAQRSQEFMNKYGL